MALEASGNPSRCVPKVSSITTIKVVVVFSDANWGSVWKRANVDEQITIKFAPAFNFICSNHCNHCNLIDRDFHLVPRSRTRADSWDRGRLNGDPIRRNLKFKLPSFDLSPTCVTYFDSAFCEWRWKALVYHFVVFCGKFPLGTRAYSSKFHHILLSTSRFAFHWF